MKRSLLFAIFVFLPLFALAQPAVDTLWTHVYPDMDAVFVDALLLPDGGYFTLGNETIIPDTTNQWKNIVLDRFNAAGESMGHWVREGLPDDDVEARSICATLDGNVVLLGLRTRNSVPSGAVIEKAGLDGTVIWRHEYYINVSSSNEEVIPVPDGGFLVVGNAAAVANPICGAEAFALKLNADGDSLWTQFYPHECSLGFLCASATADGGFILTGRYYETRSSPCKISVVKTDAEGSLEWEYMFGEDGAWQWPVGIAQLPDGGYIIGGQRPRLMMGHPYLLRLNYAGEMVWENWLEPDPHASFNSYDFAVTSDGGYILAGNVVYDNALTQSLMMVKSDSSGVWQWQSVTGSDARDMAKAVCLTGDGFLLAGGRAPINGGISQPLLARFAYTTASPETPPLQAATYTLGQNYPNPFNPETRIRFDLGSPARTALTIFDVTGRQVTVLADGMYAAGTHEVEFHGDALPSGVYFYRLTANGFVSERKMLLLK